VQETGLQLKQINNWFINQRKRNWHSNPASSSSDKSKRKRYGNEKLRQASPCTADTILFPVSCNAYSWNKEALQVMATPSNPGRAKLEKNYM
jgi:hypothetical protein